MLYLFILLYLSNKLLLKLLSSITFLINKTLYEDKIITFIKSKIKLTSKNMTTAEAEKVISSYNKSGDVATKSKEVKSTVKNKTKSKKISKK